MTYGPLDHRQWFYHPELGGEIFEIGDIVPDGWYDSPADFPENNNLPNTLNELKALGKSGVIELARREGIEFDPDDHFFTIVATVRKALDI